MNGSISWQLSRFEKRSWAIALIVVAMTGAIAILAFGTAQPALAATDGAAGNLSAGTIEAQATSPTKASAFEYKFGRYVVNGNVRKSKCWYGTTKNGTATSSATYTRTKSKYGPEFTVSTHFGASGSSGGYAAAGGGYGYDCGAGIYITGFKGSKNANVVVPNKIGGKPVVCVCLMGAKMKSLDVSRCNYLKALSVGYQIAGGTDCTIGSIKFGENRKLVHFNLDRSTVTKLVNITPKNIRELRIMFSNLKKGFSFSTPKLRSFACYGFSDLELKSNPNLRELYVPNCPKCKIDLAGMPRLTVLNVSSCGLKRLDISKNTALKTITASGNNFNKKTVSTLKKWQKAKKGRKLNLD